MAGKSVTVEIHDDPRHFLAAAGGHLAADPVLATVIATVTERMARARDAGDTPTSGTYDVWWAVARDHNGAVVGVAMRTAPYPLFLLPMPEAHVRELAQVLHGRGESIEGVNGVLPAARQFAEETARLTGGSVRVREQTTLFELGELLTPPTPPGSLRQVRLDEAGLALDWFHAFHAEADEQAGRAPDPSVGEHFTLDDMVQRIGGGILWFWVDADDHPVHLTGANHPAFGVTRIGPVFTPREERGKRYASATVAEVSRGFTAGGVRVCLFTDQANPVSNAIYQRLGFREIVNMTFLRVEP